MQLTIFGATGQTGRVFAERALGAGHALRLLVRDPSRLSPALKAAEIIEGDMNDTAKVAAALNGSKVAFSALGIADISKPTTAFSDMVKNLIAAAQAAGPRRLWLIASVLVLDAPGAPGRLRGDEAVPSMFAHIFAEHKRNYLALRESRLDWTLLCPAMLKPEPGLTSYRVAIEDFPSGGGETPIPAIADYALKNLTNAALIGKRIGICR